MTRAEWLLSKLLYAKRGRIDGVPLNLTMNEARDLELILGSFDALLKAAEFALERLYTKCDECDTYADQEARVMLPNVIAKARWGSE